MTSGHDDRRATLALDAGVADPRLVFTPTPRVAGALDGGWWPHTRSPLTRAVRCPRGNRVRLYTRL